MKNIFVKSVFIICLVGAINSFALDGIIPSEALVQRRASLTVEATSVLDARYALQKAFNLLTSYEADPTVKVGPFNYKISANERLVDALNNLTEVSNNFLQWRYKDGRVIFTVTPSPNKETNILCGDRMVTVDIHAENLYDGLLQLESTYNERYTDRPWLIDPVMMMYPVAQLTFTHEVFSLYGEYCVRDVLVQLLNALEERNAGYGTCMNNIPRKWNWPEELYNRGIKIFTLYVFAPDVSTEDEESAIRWSREVASPEMERRARQYFSNIYPDLLGKEFDKNIEEVKNK